MHEDLERLDTVDRADREIARHTRALEAARQAVMDLDAALLDDGRVLAGLAAETDELKKREKQLAREVEEQQRYRERATRALETGAGDPDAAERQLQGSSRIIDELETAQLELMEAQDDLAARRQAAESVRLEHTEQLQQARALLPVVEADVEAATAELRAARAAAWGPLPREVQTRYDDFIAKRRWAVSHIVDGACAACQRVVNQQHVTDLHRGLVKPCMGCGRWLVP